MYTESLLKQAVRGALAVGTAGTMVGAGAALAQTAPPAGTAAGTKLSNIVVTGSHIPQTAIATAQPVISINRQEIDNTGYSNVGQLLQNLSSAGSSLTLNINNGNTGGEQTINLHDLGSQRVLVLVNGQRWIPTTGGAVDLTTIPLSVVDHVDVLLDGASAIYGSEAIAGVINIVTVQNYNGAEAHAYMGMYDASSDGGGWDGKTQKYSFTVGTTGDRSGVLLSAGYYNTNPIWAGQRTISREPYIDFGRQLGSPSTEGGHIILLNGPGGQVLPGCQPSYCSLSGPSPNDPTPGFHQFTPNDNYNYSPANYLVQPTERWYTFTQGHYDITDNITFNFTTTYQKRASQAALAPTFLGLGNLFGGFATKQDGMFIGIGKNAPGNPFGVDLVPYYPSSSGFSSWCQKYGSSTCSSQYDTLLLYGLQPDAMGNRIFQQQVATFYFNGDFQGYWQMFGNQWQWTAGYIYSKRLNTSITSGLVNTARLQNSLSNDCGTASNSSCVPLDIFGAAPKKYNGQDSISPANVNYLTFSAHRVNSITLRDYNASIGGNFWNSWYAGPWGVAAGYEYEELDGFNQPDALTSLGNTTGNVIQPTGGRENTNAQYVELSIPFANNMFLAKSLGIDLAERWSQFKWSGLGATFNPNTGTIGTTTANAGAHSATPRVTFKWQPVDSLLFRGSWSQGFRIPSISELFLGASQNFPNVIDPCGTKALGTNPVPPSGVPQNCPGWVSNQPYNPVLQPSTQIGTTVGGNANLEPEKSTTRTVGFVFSPTFLEGFDFSADYYHTEVTNLVTRIGPQTLASGCYHTGPNPGGPDCPLIIRTPSGTIGNIIDLNQNGGSTKVSGWDLHAKYRFPTTPIGVFTLMGTANFMQQDIFCSATGSCSQTAGNVTGSGFFGQPHHKYNLSLDWNYGPWSAVYRMRIIGAMWENCAYAPPNGLSYTNNTSGNPDFGWCSKIISYNHPGGVVSPDPTGATSINTGQNHLGTTVYSDIQASYTVSSWNTTFTLGVNNLFDKQPPISRDAFENSFVPNFYDVPGRFFYGRVSVQF